MYKNGIDSAHFHNEMQMDVRVLPPVSDIVRIKDREIPVRDGVKLSANIYLPDKNGKYPVIMAMTIYRKEKHKSHYDTFLTIPNTHLGTMRFSEDATFEGPDPAFWCHHGYAVIHLDARGFGKSEGDPSPYTKQAYIDFYDAIEWAASQKWCDGNVGLSGVSFLGISQYYTAALKPPSLKAINPWDARTDRFRSCYLGGIPNTVMNPFIFEKFVVPSLREPIEGDELLHASNPANMPRRIDDPAYAQGVELSESIAEIEVPILIGGSVSDQAKHTRDAFENFMNVRSKDKWLYVHRDPEWAAYYAESGLAMQKKFFDHFLKKADNGWDLTPPVMLNLFENRTRSTCVNAIEWPIENTLYRKLYLSNQQTLSDTPSKQAKTTKYKSDGSESAVFNITFDQVHKIAGHMMLRVFLSIEDGSDADLFVGVKKYDVEGNEVFFLGESGNNPNDIVSRGWLRASQRRLSENSTDWRPILEHKDPSEVTPNEIMELNVEIHPTAVQFNPGETLSLVIQGASIQPTDLAMGFDEKVNSGNHVVHFGDDSESYLQIPLIEHSTAVE